jgi:hypothetical protein
MSMTPSFVRLVQLDDQHFISACRHGLIHLTWGRVTARLGRDEFRRLAALLEEAVTELPPTSLRDRDLRITYRLDEECELQVGSLILLLSPARCAELAQASQEALTRLDRILASGAWDRAEPEGHSPGVLDQFRRITFSRN